MICVLTVAILLHQHSFELPGYHTKVDEGTTSHVLPNLQDRSPPEACPQRPTRQYSHFP